MLETSRMNRLLAVPKTRKPEARNPKPRNWRPETSKSEMPYRFVGAGNLEDEQAAGRRGRQGLSPRLHQVASLSRSAVPTHHHALQGYLVHKKPTSSLAPLYGHRHGPTVGSWGGTACHMQGTAVLFRFLSGGPRVRGFEFRI